MEGKLLFLAFQDPVEGKKVVQNWLRYLDARSLWEEGALVEVSTGVLREACAHGRQLYMLFSSLVRHVATPGLSATQRRIVVQRAETEGAALEAALASPALMLALKVWPPD